MHCDTVISPEPTGITAVITIRYWLRCFGDRNQKRNLQPRLFRTSQVKFRALIVKGKRKNIEIGNRPIRIYEY